MEGADYLFTCAEVAVALAGFSAIIVVFREQGGAGLPPGFRALVSSLIERSLVAVFLAFLPPLLFGLGASASQVWLVSSGGLGAYIATLAWRGASLRRRDPAAVRMVSGPAFLIIFFLGLLNLALQFAHALGLGVEQSVWWYLVGLTWLLASIAYLFFFAIRDWVRKA